MAKSDRAPGQETNAEMKTGFSRMVMRSCAFTSLYTAHVLHSHTHTQKIPLMNSLYASVSSERSAINFRRQACRAAFLFLKKILFLISTPFEELTRYADSVLSVCALIPGLHLMVIGGVRLFACHAANGEPLAVHNVTPLQQSTDAA